MKRLLVVLALFSATAAYATSSGNPELTATGPGTAGQVYVSNGSLNSSGDVNGHFIALPAGPQGVAGATGAQGPQGTTGSTGKSGADGTNGKDGAKGDAGTPGKDGNNELDALRLNLGIDVRWYDWKHVALTSGYRYDINHGGQTVDMLVVHIKLGSSYEDREIAKLKRLLGVK